MSSKFGFILVKPQLGENIGACARAMKNFGFSKLYIVEPKINFPNHKAKATSVGAYDIINKAKVFNNIQDAIEPFNLVISLSARRRDINKKNIYLSGTSEILGINSKEVTPTRAGKRFGALGLRFQLRPDTVGEVALPKNEIPKNHVVIKEVSYH